MLCVAENRGKTNEFLKMFLKDLGKVSVVSKVQYYMVRDESSEMFYKCSLAENINICPKYFKISLSPNRLDLLFMHHSYSNFPSYP